MRIMAMVVMLVALALSRAGTAQAQDSLRPAAFALNCYIPTTPGLHTRASLTGKIKLAQRTIRFVASCSDNPSTSQFPELQVKDGEVQTIDVSVVTYLETSTSQMIASNPCSFSSRNGFLTARCMASEAYGGEVEILVSIAPLVP